VVPFGEEGLFVDAAVPSGLAFPTAEVWVSLNGWTILEQAPPRMLAVDAVVGPSFTLPFARLLSESMKGSVTVMGFAETTDASEDLRAAFKSRIADAGMQPSDVHIRSGDFAPQLAAECAGSLFEMIILPPRFDPDASRAIEPAVIAAVERPDIATFVLQGECTSIRRILICTRAGEPGKTDVRFGGRLARHLGATVTLLYITTGTAEASTFARAHLEKASTTLRGLEVANEIRIVSARTPAEGIVRAAADHDVIVLGGHGPTSRSIFAADDVTMQVLLRANRPVLVVPAEEF
jgi:nucleotide-binding universal stress UspA family protein